MGFQDYFGRIANAVKGADEDISEDFHERITSPFLISFLISFLIVNWEMWTGLLFLTREDLKVLGYDNQIEYIRGQRSWWLNFWKPSLFALGYTILYPILREGVRIARAWVSTWGSKLMNKALKDNRVPLEVLVARRKEINRIEKELNDVLTKESDTLRKLNDTKVSLDASTSELQIVSEKLRQLEVDNTTQGENLVSLNAALLEFQSLDERQAGPKFVGEFRFRLSDNRNVTLNFNPNNYTVTFNGSDEYFIGAKVFSVKGLPGFLSISELLNISQEIILFFTHESNNTYSGRILWDDKVYEFYQFSRV